MRRWRNYDSEDYRIEPYCKAECKACKISDNGQAFCFGKFKKGDKFYQGNGEECTKIVNFCFQEKTELLNG